MKNLKLYEEFGMNEDEGVIKNIKLDTSDDKKFKDDFTVNNKYMFDKKLSDEERTAILMSKIDAIAKKKRLNPNQAKKLKGQYAKELDKMGGLEKAEAQFKDQWYYAKSKGQKLKDKAKSVLKRLIAPDAGSVSSFTILDDFMQDLFNEI